MIKINVSSEEAIRVKFIETEKLIAKYIGEAEDCVQIYKATAVLRRLIEIRNRFNDDMKLLLSSIEINQVEQ